MKTWIVTVKLPRNRDHNPADKKVGPCPFGKHGTCTDVTGEHHSVLHTTLFAEDARLYYVNRGYHVTRVEEV